MAENSKIEWCSHTFNPWIGCQHVSAGCDHCYAETQNAFRRWVPEWGPGTDRRRTSEANWKKPLAWAKAARGFNERPRVFCASLADWLDNMAEERWREDLCNLIEATPELDWLLLTKRPENYRRLAPYPWRIGAPPPNVWLGITAEDQPNYDRRWPIIREIDASVLFVSYEPALGPLHIADFISYPDWIICGGESGGHARMMDPAWARHLRDQCARRGVSYFFKQMTRKAPIPADLLVRQFPTPRRIAAAA
jgi:protein gp37